MLIQNCTEVLIELLTTIFALDEASTATLFVQHN